MQIAAVSHLIGRVGALPFIFRLAHTSSCFCFEFLPEFLTIFHIVLFTKSPGTRRSSYLLGVKSAERDIGAIW